MDAIDEAFERAEQKINLTQNEVQRYCSPYGENGIDVPSPLDDRRRRRRDTHRPRREATWPVCVEAEPARSES